MTRQTSFPICERGHDAVLAVIRQAEAEGRLGLDFEFNESGPYIIGVASRERMAAANWDRRLGEAVATASAKLVAHAGIGADKPVLEQALGIHTPLSQWSDSMVRHWICNADLASTPKSLFGEDATDTNVMGFMNLWAMTSLYHDLPYWKGYVRIAPDGRVIHSCAFPAECLKLHLPCPMHDAHAYCAADAWAGLICDYSLIDEMAARGIPESYYDFCAEITEYAKEIGEKGVYLDINVARNIDETIAQRKLTLFPYEEVWYSDPKPPTAKQIEAWHRKVEKWFLKVASPPKPLKAPKKPSKKSAKTSESKPKKSLAFPEYPKTKPAKKLKAPRKVWKGPFNANSPQAVLRWLEEHGIDIRDRGGKQTLSKPELLKELDKRLKPYGYKFDVLEADVVALDDSIQVEADFPEELDILVRLAQKTCATKGTKPWTDDKYLEKEPGLPPNIYIVHGRVNSTGTSTIRMAMSKPNCFDALTEVLTEEGWKYLKDVAFTDKVMQWDEGTLSFVHPTQLTSRLYSGRMVALKNEHIDLRITEDHRCLTQNRRNGKFNVYPAIDYPKDQRQYNAGLFNGPGLSITDAELQFLVAVQADGSITKNNAIDFSFKKQRKASRLKKLLVELNYEFRDCSTDVRFRYLIRDPKAIELVKRYLPQKQFDKWILLLSQEQLNLFLEETRHWDGLFEAPRLMCFASKHKTNVDWVQTAAVLANQRAILREYTNNFGRKFYETWITPTAYSLTTNIGRSVEQVTNERVYCLSVPSSFVLVRRGGCVMVTGQCMNVPSRSLLAELRKAYIAKPGPYKFAKGDYSQLEFRVCLWHAGVDPNEADGAFEKYVELAGDDLEEPARRMFSGKRRDVAKSLVHAGDLGESLKLYSAEDLRSPKIVADRDAGALWVYDGSGDFPEWKYKGLTVAFTGNNIAERLFGQRTREYRRRALGVMGIYFRDMYPQIREWQMRITREAEETGYATLKEIGHQVRLDNRIPEDDLKFLFTIKGQGGGALYAREGMLRFKRKGVVMNLMVHDEFDFMDIPESWTDDEVREFFQPAIQESEHMPGFHCPMEIKIGANWRETTSIGKIRLR